MNDSLPVRLPQPFGDLDGDNSSELVVPSDVHYIAAYEANGVQLPASSIYGNKAWGKVGVHVDRCTDIGRIENVHFNPNSWTRSGPTRPSTARSTSSCSATPTVP